MIMGDELDLDWADIRAEAAPARDPYKDPVSGVQITGGSTGVRNMYEAMSKASATVRAMLVSAAGIPGSAPENELRTEKGAVIHDKTGRKMTYGELCGAGPRGLSRRKRRSSRKTGSILWESQCHVWIRLTR